jgi:hypothetical protein|tara:strand:- start:1645 stop:2022 length:378 start_codon:yes stop_codon:yes gene_type:complete
MSIFSSLIGPAAEIVGKFVQDKDKAAELAHTLSTMADRHAQEAMLAQIEVNKAEAQGNWFQASWRPLCGYVCVLGLAVNFLISPIAAGFGFAIPQAEMATMMPILTGMLGLAGMRSFEKVKKVAK